MIQTISEGVKRRCQAVQHWLNQPVIKPAAKDTPRHRSDKSGRTGVLPRIKAVTITVLRFVRKVSAAFIIIAIGLLPLYAAFAFYQKTIEVPDVVQRMQAESSQYSPVPTNHTLDVFNEGIVTVTFDDNWRSVYTEAYPVMQEYSIPSTQYVIASPMLSSEYMTEWQLADMLKNGHEISAHSLDHPDLVHLKPSELEKQLAVSKRLLEDRYGITVKDMASPLGSYNEETLRAITRYYRSHRTVDPGYNTATNFNPYRIKVRNLAPDITIEEFELWLAQAHEMNAWVVLVYHQVDQSNSPYSVTPEAFEAQMTAVRRSGLKTATMGEVLDRMYLEP